MADEPQKWSWQDGVALLVATVWAISFMAPLFKEGYAAPIEVHFVFMMVLAALGLANKPRE